MPWEDVGSAGVANAVREREWMAFQTEMAVTYIEHICGDPPPGCELGLMWHEHEMADYVTVGVWWDLPDAIDVPWAYIEKAEIALEAINEAINWGNLHPEIVRDEFPEAESDAIEGG